MRRSWIWFVVGVVAGLAALVTAHLMTTLPRITRDNWGPGLFDATRHSMLLYLGSWWVLFAITAVALLRAPRRASVAAASVLGLAGGVISVVPRALLSDDLYRYAWDGWVQAAGIDPYRYPPDSSRLAFLRESWLWPSDAVCGTLGKGMPCTLINRPGVNTIYPPVAQWWFRFADAVLPDGARDRGWELLGLLLAVLTALALAAVLRRAGRDPRWIVLWTCCPLVPLEAVQSAHVDALAALFLALAVLVLVGGAVTRRRQIAAAVLLSLSGLVKLYPFVLLPALVQRRRPTAWAAAALLAVLAYLPYLLDIGQGVTGYLKGYLEEGGYTDGERYLLLSVTGVSGPHAKAVAYAVVGLVGLLAVFRRLGPPLPAAVIVFATLLLVATPGEPWYELVFLVLVVASGSWQWLGLIAAEYVAYLSATLQWHHLPASRTAYALALLLGLGVPLARRLLGRHRAVPSSA